MSPDGPEERTFEREESYEREIAEIELSEQLADESVFTPGSIDSIPWPTAISVRPVQVKGYKS